MIEPYFTHVVHFDYVAFPHYPRLIEGCFSFLLLLWLLSLFLYHQSLWVF